MIALVSLAVFDQPLAVVRAVALTDLAEALTRRSPGDHVHPARTDELLQAAGENFVRSSHST